jgi:hypothetical protein
MPDEKCNGITEPQQQDSIESLRLLRRRVNESKKLIEEGDTQKNQGCKESNQYKNQSPKGPRVPLALLFLTLALQPMMAMRLSAKAVVWSIQCLYLTLMRFPFRVFRAVRCTAIDIILAKEYSRQEIRSHVYVMMNSISCHWYTTGIDLGILYFGLRASLLNVICQ